MTRCSCRDATVTKMGICSLFHSFHLLVSSGFVWCRAQGQKSGATAKNDEFRVIPMTNRAHELLLELDESDQESDAKQLQVLDWKDIKKSLHSAGVRAGIGHVHLHMLRHTFATRLRDKGVAVQKWTGGIDCTLGDTE